MHKDLASRSVSTRDLSKEKVDEEKEVDASDSDAFGSRIFEDWYLPNFIDDLLRQSKTFESPTAPLYNYPSISIL